MCNQPSHPYRKASLSRGNLDYLNETPKTRDPFRKNLQCEHSYLYDIVGVGRQMRWWNSKVSIAPWRANCSNTELAWGINGLLKPENGIMSLWTLEGTTCFPMGTVKTVTVMEGGSASC
jgi:hypothetical protein